MKRSCTRCGAPAGKGKHYLATKTPTATTRWGFSCCNECGELLQIAAHNALTKWRRKEAEP